MSDRRPKLSDQRDSFDVGLLGCIRSPDLCTCFRSFLDEIGCLAPLNFLEAVETLHSGLDKTKNLTEHSAVDSVGTELARLALRNGSADLGQITSARERQSTTGSSVVTITSSPSASFVGPKRRKSVAEHINRSLLHTAKAIYKRFFEDSATFRSLGLHLSDKERLKAKLQALSPAVPDDADAAAQLHASETIARVFDSCEEAVLLEMERELYPRFQRSDAYVAMLSIHLDQKQNDLDGADGITIGSAVKDDSDDERAESIDSSASTATNATNAPVSVQFSSIPEDEATDQNDVVTPKFTPLVSVTDDTIQAEADRTNQSHRESTGWVNEEAYESIHIDVLSAKGLRDGAFGRPPNPYCRVTVGTTIFKNKALANTNSPDWTNDQSASHFEFPLRNTVSFIDIDLFDSQLMWSDKHLGSVRVHISPLIEAQRQRERSQGPQITLSAMQATANAISGSPKESNSTSDSSASGPNAENGFGAPAITLPIRKTGDDKTQAPKQRGELKVVITFHKSKAQNPVSHKAVVVGSTSFVADAIRNTVSKKKKRFVKDGFDLDLSYITDRVIAMGFPSEKVEGVFRNNLTTVKLFFDKRHGNHYMIYNLCAEREYDPAKFEGRVCRFGFFDHNPCPFGMIEDFCKHVHKWLTAHSQHVAAIHCKAGKGRTGLLICCYMLFTGLFPTAVQSLKYYAARRTKNRKGVTIPSQIRYVHYYERYLRFQRLLQRVQSRLGDDSKERAEREKSILEREQSAVVDEKFDETGSPPTSGNLSTPTGNRFGDGGKRKSGPSLTKEQQIAARILGFRNRKMSVTERADVLDYLHMRNSRYPVDRSSPTPRRPLSGNLDQIPESRELRVDVPSPRTAPVTNVRVVAPAPADAAQPDEDLMSTLEPGSPVAVSHEPFLRGSYFLPDADKHHVFLNKVIFHGLPSSGGAGVSFKVKNPDLQVEFSSKSIVASSPLLSPATGPMTPLSTASAPPATSTSNAIEVQPKWDKESNTLSFDLPPRSVHVFGDVQFVFSNNNMFGSGKMFHFWLNTRFVVADGGSVILTKPEIDKVNKDKKHKAYPADFAVEVQFEVLEEFKNNLYSQLDSLELKYKELDALISNDDHHIENSVLTDSVDDISLLPSGTGQSLSGGSTGSPKHSITAGNSGSGPSTPPSHPVASPSLPLSAASDAYVPHSNPHRIKIETRQSQANSTASNDSAPDA